ncbi:MAG: bifunctional ADP-dependent NAD(P)H-hydrate dehydratase/NAD(P)H-hydrate epimerase, partial [Blastocatellia bacterium]
MNEGPSDREIDAAFLSSDFVIDAIFGTGLTRPLSGLATSAAAASNAVFRRSQRPYLISVDVPSGLSTFISERAEEAFRADLTVSFTAPKPENVLPPFYRN